MLGTEKFSWLRNSVERSMKKSSTAMQELEASNSSTESTGSTTSSDNSDPISYQGITACQTYDPNLKFLAAVRASKSASPPADGEPNCKSRSVSGSTCISGGSPTFAKDHCSSSLEIAKYQSHQPTWSQERLDDAVSAQSCLSKQHREEVLQLELSHVVEVNDLKSLLACREMVHKNEMEDIQQAHGSELFRIQREAQSITSTTLSNAQTFFYQTLESFQTERREAIEALGREHKSALQRSRLSSLGTVHKLVESAESDQKQLDELKEELIKVSSDFSTAKAGWGTETDRIREESQSLQAMLKVSKEWHKRELILAQDEIRTVKSTSEELTGDSRKQVLLAQEEIQRLKVALEVAEERNSLLEKQHHEEKNTAEKLWTHLQNDAQKTEAILHEVKQQSAQDLLLAQQESQRFKTAADLAGAHNTLIQNQYQQEKKVNEELRMKVQDVSQKAELAAEEAEQQSERELNLVKEKSNQLSAVHKLIEQRITELETQCQEEKFTNHELQENLQKIELAKDDHAQKFADMETGLKLAEEEKVNLENERQQEKVINEALRVELRQLMLANGNQIRRVTETENTWSEQVAALEDEKAELKAKADLMEKSALSFQEDRSEQSVDTGTSTPVKGASQDCTLCPKKSRNIRKLRSVNKSLSTKVTEGELVTIKLKTKLAGLEFQHQSDLSKERLASQGLLDQKEKELAATQNEGELQITKLSKWITNLVLASNDAEAQLDSNKKTLILKDAKIASMTSDVEQVAELRLRHAALVESTADNLARKEPNLQIDCKYMVDQITLMNDCGNAVDKLYAEALQQVHVVEKERDDALQLAALHSENVQDLRIDSSKSQMELKDLRRQLAATPKGHEDRAECRREIDAKSAQVVELQTVVEELQEKAAHMQRYTSCYQNLKAALERNEEEKLKGAAHNARWSKVMLEELGARFEKKRVQELHKEVARRLAKMEAEEKGKLGARGKRDWSS